jgi:5,10-methylenetetrahydrofolate reductase
MNCKKQMRNGPCGGVRADGACEAMPSMRCVWLEATEGRRRIAGGQLSDASRLVPLDHRARGRSTWAQVIAQDASPVQAAERASHVCREAGSFERACTSGRFLVTVEVAPPDSVDPGALLARARRFTGLVDAINITDGAGGNCHMSSVAASALLAANGFTAVCQVTCRDRNRIARQGDIMGAAALGVRNILCLTGDDVSQGDQPQAKPVFDLDAVSLLQVASGMRDQGIYASGRPLERPPNLFLGATANPFVPPHRQRVANLQAKIDAGAQFIQTQFCFDLALLENFMREVRARELHKRAHIIVGVGTLGTARALRWLVQHVPGVHIPEAILRRIGAAEDQKSEGKRVCVEMIRALAQIEGVSGVHLMGHRNEDLLAEVILASGVRQPVAEVA